MKKTKLLFVVAIAAVMVLSLVACNGENKDKTTESNTGTTTGSPSETSTETSSTTGGDAQKPVLLVVSFGTSYDNREHSIGALEKALQDAYPDYEVRRAFTSQIIIDILKERDKIEIDNVKQAMDRLVADGVKNVVIQPTHVMSGFEYNDVADEIKPYIEKFESVKFGKPLLSTTADFEAVAKILVDSAKNENVDGTGFVFVGHGTEHSSNSVYTKLQDTLEDMGAANFFIGTVEAEPDFEAVVKALKKNEGIKKLYIAPLMVVAGDHAENDICGDEDDSWKKMLEAEGYEVVPVLKGLGQYEDIQKIYVDHAKKAMESALRVGPVTGDMLVPGSYNIDVNSSSSMFRVVSASLLVAEDGKMTTTITLSGKGYEKLFLGKGKDAESATDDKFYPFQEDKDGMYFYTFPLEALDKDIDCAAFSKKKQSWYDRILVFVSDSLPIEAFK